MEYPIMQQLPDGQIGRSFNSGRASLPTFDTQREAEFRRSIRLSLFGRGSGSPPTKSTHHQDSNSDKENVTPSKPAKLVKRQDTSKLKSRRASLSTAFPKQHTSSQPIYAPFEYNSSSPKYQQNFASASATSSAPAYDTYAPFEYDQLPGRRASTSDTIRPTLGRSSTFDGVRRIHGRTSLSDIARPSLGRASLSDTARPAIAELSTPRRSVDNERLPTKNYDTYKPREAEVPFLYKRTNSEPVSTNIYDTYQPRQAETPVTYKRTSSEPVLAKAYDSYEPRGFSTSVTYRVGDRTSLSAQVYDTYTPLEAKAILPRPSHKMAPMGPTITVKPIQPPSFKSDNKGLYSIDEQGVASETDGLSYDAQTPKTIAEYPMYPGLQSTSQAPVNTPPRRVLNQPRRLSQQPTTNATKSGHNVRETARMEMRISTWGHHMNDFPTIPSPSSPHSPRHKRPEALKGQRKVRPSELFERLTPNILVRILELLRDDHVGPNSESCATCWMRDATNVCLASRTWAKAARSVLYESIQIIGADSAAHKKKFKLNQGGRLLLLRRTLRSNNELAEMVRFVKVPQLEVPSKGGLPPKAIEQYDDLVSTLVMACPNLERLSSSMTSYDHTFKRIFHALSTRRKLRQMDWLIEASPAQQRQQRAPRPKVQGLIDPENLLPFEEQAWLDVHANWRRLKTLSIHCLPGATLTPATLLPQTFAQLQSLEHLHICNLPATAFNDDNLLALPPLKTLTLSHISGVTSQGLSAFATRIASGSLENLHLRHTNLTSLPALARIFSNCTRLTNFSLIQAFSPKMPEADAFSLWMMPYLASTSVKKLHWDITSMADNGDEILAKSIAAGGFPALNNLRVPNDPDGLFQALCRPVERIDLPSDRFLVGNAGRREEPSPPSSPLGGIGFLSKSSTSTSLATLSSMSSLSSTSESPASCTNLRTARLAAQARLESARCAPKFKVQVTEDESLVEAFDMAGYIGTIGSTIHYDLRPDAGSSDEKGGLVDVRDLAQDSGESLMSAKGMETREGCTGVWNRGEGVVADKKEKERWWHTERGRWNPITL